tara:strand:+ start:487 stop:1137 length:651 start_codon:yes stop_codon:yes gene_type:complete
MRLDKSKDDAPMKRLIIAAGLSLSSVAIFCSPAAAQEDAYENGYALYETGDYVEAAKWYRLAAEQGDRAAPFILGKMYARGEGVPENHEEAVKWWRLSAEQSGDATEQLGLALIYDDGAGIPEDNVEAVKWYRLAADQGDADAQLGLAGMYSRGEGVPEDYVQAFTWLNLSAAKGNTYAAKNKEKLRKMMTSEQIADAQRLSAEWKPGSERTSTCP